MESLRERFQQVMACFRRIGTPARVEQDRHDIRQVAAERKKEQKDGQPFYGFTLELGYQTSHRQNASILTFFHICGSLEVRYNVVHAQAEIRPIIR